MKCIDEVSKSHFPKEIDILQRINISLRIWSGCLSAGKKHRLEKPRSGNNTSMSRQIAFSRINVWTKIDPIYRSGVESAPVWKRLINQGDDIHFDGIPSDSPVMKYMNTD